ncbi:hypothetical protein [Clostridium butyricum]|uniref:hypothetical protein n=1 Tax=Clostridium butyricum TaxID=1492 RepID=UPI0004269062|nr:hypothetical protein [Clostridium butyricum]
MKFWTTQSEKVLKIILEDKAYRPDFKLSDGLGSKQMRPSYDEMLNEYQLRNQVSCSGLVFGISKLDDLVVNSINEYRKYFFDNPTFWDSVSSAGENYATLELEIPDKLDLVPIYFQDFIILGLRCLRDFSFNYYVKEQLVEEEFHSFKEDLKISQTIGWTNDIKDMFGESMLNKITQVHVHEILLDNIVNIYPTVNFETNEEYNLNKKAIQLKEMIKNKK